MPEAQQAEEVEQGEEVLPLVQPLQRKAGLHLRVHPPLADDVPQQIEVAVELPAHHEQMTQLAVVDTDVGVDQLPRQGLVRDGLAQVVEHHVRVVEIALHILGEPVAVVPLAHHVQRGVHVLVEHAAVSIYLQQAAHLVLGETPAGR